MTLKTLAAAACISLASATTAISAPITLDFAFDDVTGTFYGLDDNDGSYSASSFDLSFGGRSWTGISATFGIRGNLFRFKEGQLVDILFDGIPRAFGDAFDEELSTISIVGNFGQAGIILGTDPISQEGAINYEINPVSAVPLPAGGLLLLSAFGGVAALKRRKKRAA